jgi:hypothetical protein
MNRIVCALSLACIWSAPASAQDFPAALLEASDAISGDRLHGDVAFLADDMLEGRGTGTRGYDLAAKYVANRFAALGLEPGFSSGEAGGVGSYFQPVPFRCATLDESRSSLVLTQPPGSESKKPAKGFKQAIDYVI